ncbi:hypothetical protein HDU97_004857 [Phlyctochytrium planicorne]|nr:hypothetical protein HDU97_004857 [Phlyctochytrium planicorne]
MNNQQPLQNLPAGLQSPPRNPTSRKASVVERTIGTNMLRRNSASTGPSMPQPSAGSQSSNTSLHDEIIFSMSPNDYELGTTIGYGSSAIVYIAKYKPLGKIVAIKVIDLDMFERNQIDELRREIQIMSLSKHPNLLPVYGSFVNGSKLYIVTPFLSAGSCLDIMKTAYPNGLEESAIATILKQGLQGMEYLHKNGLIHRDVKAGNLLVDDDGTVQLADFGVSSSLMETGERKGIRKTFVGTPCWMAPEVMEQSGYDYKADIWSFGITALELATGHAPFAKYPPLKVLMLTLQNDPPTLDREQTAHKYSKSFKDMIDSCLQKDPSKRPTAEKLLQHSFFKQATKRRQHLATDILQNLPPITKRQHNKKSFPPERDDSKGVSWDFDSPDDESDAKPKEPTVSFAPSTLREEIPSNEGSLSDGSNQDLDAAGRKGILRKDSEMVESPSTTLGPAAGVEVKKGRFSVSESNQQNQGSDTNSRGSDSQFSSPTMAPSPSQEGARQLGRFAVSSESQAPPPQEGRPSRFTVKSNEATSVIPQQNLPQVPDKRGRFEVSNIEGQPQPTSDSSQSPNSSPSNSLSRNSRFQTPLVHQVAHGVMAQTPANSSTTGVPPNAAGHPADKKLDTILRQNEMLKQMLGDIVANLPKTPSVKIPDAGQTVTRANVEHGHEDAGHMTPHDAQVLAILQENEMLRIENEQLKAPYESQVIAILQENEMLRKENEQLRVVVASLENQLNSSQQ